MHTYTCVCRYMYVCVKEIQRLALCLSFSTLFFETGSLTVLELSGWAIWPASSRNLPVLVLGSYTHSCDLPVLVLG